MPQRDIGQGERLDPGGPGVIVEPGACVPAGPGLWRISWRLSSPEPLDLLESWLPHDHFQAPRQRHEPPVDRPAELERMVACEDPPGGVIENAFLILRVGSAGKTWRVFARLRVTIDPEGTPHQTCEAVTCNR